MQNLLTQTDQFSDLLLLVEQCSTSRYFLFLEKCHQQTTGTTIDVLPYKPKIWLCYVDDTQSLFGSGGGSIRNLFEYLNSQHRYSIYNGS